MAKSVALAVGGSRLSRLVISGSPTAASLQNVTNGTSRAASALITHGGDLRDPQGVREYGRYASFLLYETSGAVRKLRRLDASPLASKPQILPSRTSRPPILLLNLRYSTRQRSQRMARQRRPRGGGANSATWKRPRKLLRFGLQRGSPSELLAQLGDGPAEGAFEPAEQDTVGRDARAGQVEHGLGAVLHVEHQLHRAGAG
jgi:hypothetical protein